MRTGMMYNRQPGPISVNSTHRLTKESSLTTMGTDTNRTTIGTYNRHTGGFFLLSHFVLTQILWDIYTTGTYDIDFVDGLSNTPTVLRNIGTGLSFTGGAENTILVSPEILLLPGRHYLSFLKSSTATRVADRNVLWNPTSGPLIFYDASYNGGTTGQYSMAVKLVGYLASVYNAVNYIPTLC